MARKSCGAPASSRAPGFWLTSNSKGLGGCVSGSSACAKGNVSFATAPMVFFCLALSSSWTSKCKCMSGLCVMWRSTRLAGSSSSKTSLKVKPPVLSTTRVLGLKCAGTLRTTIDRLCRACIRTNVVLPNSGGKPSAETIVHSITSSRGCSKAKFKPAPAKSTYGPSPAGARSCRRIVLLCTGSSLISLKTAAISVDQCPMSTSLPPLSTPASP
mmetsp:Transcript_120874/g.341764  ORF Transcript_120874/g.341764 Transcript_120874/m.341764 type:complete len:214 (-) Transcript_120874:1356-1997(-)